MKISGPTDELALIVAAQSRLRDAAELMAVDLAIGSDEVKPSRIEAARYHAAEAHGLLAFFKPSVSGLMVEEVAHVLETLREPSQAAAEDAEAKGIDAETRGDLEELRRMDGKGGGDSYKMDLWEWLEENASPEHIEEAEMLKAERDFLERHADHLEIENERLRSTPKPIDAAIMKMDEERKAATACAGAMLCWVREFVDEIDRALGGAKAALAYYDKESEKR
jgi:hypothetical protein